MTNSIIIENLKVKGSRSGVKLYTDDIIKYLQVIKLYREDLNLLEKIHNSNNSGVYILTGTDEYGRTVVYTGESDNICRRIKNEHDKSESKDFFNEIFLITTEDNTLNKADILYLEDSLYNRFKLSPNVKIVNSKTTTSGNIDRRQKTKLDIFSDIIIDVLSSATNCNFLDLRYDAEDDHIFTLRGTRGVGLTATYTKGKLIIHKDSIISETIAKSAPKYIALAREEMEEREMITKYKESLVLTEDYEISNINRGTNIMLGASITGASKKWLNYYGVNLEDFISGEDTNSEI